MQLDPSGFQDTSEAPKATKRLVSVPLTSRVPIMVAHLQHVRLAQAQLCGYWGDQGYSMRAELLEDPAVAAYCSGYLHILLGCFLLSSGVLICYPKEELHASLWGTRTTGLRED